jgi:hypothetical protein
MIPLIVIGAVVVIGLIARVGSARPTRADEDPHLPPPHPPPLPTEEPPPTRPRPFIGPLPPPDPRRQDRIARLFVLETEDEPLPYGGRTAIQRRYNMAAEWVRREVGQHVAYHPDITYLQLPYTSAEIRRVVLSGAAANGVYFKDKNTKEDSPLFGRLRVPADEFAEPTYPGGLPALIFGAIEGWAVAEGDPLNNPRNPELIPLQQNWLFIIRGAGGYAAGRDWREGDVESVGWAICGDAVLSAWLSEGTDEENIAHEVIFVEDTWGRQEWEAGWNRNDIDFPLSLRQQYGTPDAQTGSFIHETFHAIFNAIHVSQSAIDELPVNDPRRAVWAADPVNNIMGGSHLDWDNKHGPATQAKVHAITLDEMHEVDYWL